MSRQNTSAGAVDTAGLVTRTKDLLFLHEDQCRHDRGFTLILDQYSDSLAVSSRLQLELGSAGLCASCGMRNESCCYDGVQNLYDSSLMFINMMLGCDLARQCEPGAGCFFCGVTGCSLIAKHAYCHNYYCREIKISLGPAGITRLRSTVGRELSLQWELERLLAGMSRLW